jgi:hypothetical protein
VIECPEFETLAAWRELPGSDARRAHVESCPRCRARLAAMDEFVTPTADELPAGEWAAAREELGRRRAGDERLRSRGGAEVVRMPRHAPRWRLALALGAAAALVAISAVTWLGVRGRQAPALRESGPAAWAPTVKLQARTIRISWAAVPQAETYRLVFSDPTLEPIATLEAGPRLDLELRVDSLPAGLAPHRSLVVQAEALRGADVIATSRSAPLRLP